jgi:tetratricopeptide (TPR) repeat protein
MAYFGLKRNREVRPLIKKYVQKGLEIDPDHPAAYHGLGLLTACIELKQSEAEWLYKRSLELNPNDPMALQNYSIGLVSMGQFEQARKLANRAKVIDPLSDFIELCVAFPDFYTSKYDKFLERMSKYSEVNPPFLWGLWYLWRAYSIIGKKREAVEVCKKMFLAAGTNEIVQAMEKAGEDNALHTAASILAGIYKQHYSSPYNIAILFSHAGNKKEAFSWLEKSVEEEDPKLHLLNVDPEWQYLHNDERFLKWVRKFQLIP